jgi:diacylglycerol kinase family enzyme
MRFIAVLNRDGGTLRTTDLDAFSNRMHEVMEAAGHSVDIGIVGGPEIVAALEKAAAMRSVDVVIAGGGDGTISAAAGILMNRKKALAILPAGTMNLFARSLGIPQGIDAALTSFADGQTKSVDVASANGRPFVHQFSIGLHAKMVHLREKMEYRSRLGKIRASLSAAVRTVMNPPGFDVTLKMGDSEIVARASGIGVSNNLFGEGHLPYADHPDGGVLGIYVTVAQARSELLRFGVNMARGRWRNNEQVEIHEADAVTLKLKAPSKRLRCVIDGELCQLERTTELRIHKSALTVLVPRKAAKAAAA